MPPSCGLKNLTSVTLPPVWTHLCSVYTPAPLTKQGFPPPCLAQNRGSSQHNAREQIWTPPSDLTVVHCCVELVNQLISFKIPTLVAAYFMLTTVCVLVCVCMGVCGPEWVCHFRTINCTSANCWSRESITSLFYVKHNLIATFWFLLL